MPFVLCTVLRLLGHGMYSAEGGGKREDVERGILALKVKIYYPQINTA